MLIRRGDFGRVSFGLEKDSEPCIGLRMNSNDDTLIPVWRDGTLVPFGKLEAHRLGLRHKAVSVFLLSPRGVLLQQRASGKYHTPDLWANTCCTHPHWDEAPEACAHRRLAEELGIENVGLEWREQVEYRADVGGGLTEHEVVDIFVGHVDDASPLALNKDEVQATRWVSRARLEAEIAAAPQIFTPWLKIYLADHERAIFG